MTVEITAFQALRTPNFRLLWLAQIVSGFGDKITYFALAFVTWELTRSALFTVFSVVVATVPNALFGFVGGAIADAVGHRRAMIACDAIRVVAIGLIPLALAMGAPLAIPYTLVFLSATCSAVFNPARIAIIPDLVPRAHLGAGNAIVFASDRSVEIVGSILAGVLVAVLGAAAFYLDAMTFAVSGLLLLRIVKVEPPARTIPWGQLASEATSGIRFIRENAVLRANTVFSLLAQLSIPVFNGLTPVLIFREFAGGPEQLGVVEAAQAVGVVAAGLALPAILSRTRKGRLLVIGFAAYGLNLMAIAASPSLAVALVFFVIAGVANVVFFVPNVTISQEIAPAHLRARVFGSRTALLNLTWLPIVLVTGSVADEVSAALLIWIAGAFTLLVALGGLLFRSVRDVP